jgi:NitT/TauT family transport system substrate-binding protein
VKRFVSATLKGLSYSIEHPQEAAEIMKKSHRELDAELGAAELVKVGQLAVLPNAPLGKIDPGRAQKTIEVVESAFSLKKPVTVDETFSLKFVQ